MNLNGAAVIVKKRATDAELRSELDALRAGSSKALEKREKKLAEKKELAAEVIKIKEKSIENLDDLVYRTARNLKGTDVHIAKRPIDIAEYIRDVIGREKLGIVPSVQTIEAEVMQAFYISNKVEILSKRYSGQSKGRPSVHPYIPYPIDSGSGQEENLREKSPKAKPKHTLLSATVLTENGNIYLEEEEMEVFKSYESPFILVSADRIFSESDADKVEHLMEVSSGYMIKASKTNMKGRLIIFDNGRLALSRSPYKDLLKCINCYACSLYCPVYLSIGGLFGAPMMSGIGALSVSYQEGIKAGVGRGLYHCSQCKRCDEECPVGVPITSLIREMIKKAGASGI